MSNKLKIYSKEDIIRVIKKESFEGLSQFIADLSEQLYLQDARINYLESLISSFDFPLTFEETLNLKFPQKVTFGAEMYIPNGMNFHELKYDKEGKAVRWTGPGKEFEFDLNFDRSETKTGRLTVGYTSDLKDIDSFPCYIDNESIPIQINKKGHFLEVSFKIPKININRSSNIKFVSPVLHQPSKIDPKSNDSRILGVRFYKLEII